MPVPQDLRELPHDELWTKFLTAIASIETLEAEVTRLRAVLTRVLAAYDALFDPGGLAGEVEVAVEAARVALKGAPGDVAEC